MIPEGYYPIFLAIVLVFILLLLASIIYRSEVKRFNWSVLWSLSLHFLLRSGGSGRDLVGTAAKLGDDGTDNIFITATPTVKTSDSILHT